MLCKRIKMSDGEVKEIVFIQLEEMFEDYTYYSSKKSEWEIEFHEKENGFAVFHETENYNVQYMYSIVNKEFRDLYD